MSIEPFLTSPWQGNIDLTTNEGRKLWAEGITPLKTTFSGMGKDLPAFLADITNRVKRCHWMAELIINGKSILTQYGEINEQDVLNARATRDGVSPTSLAEARPNRTAS